MTTGHVIPDDAVIVENGMPLGYLYSRFVVEGGTEVIESGHYDEDTQLWVLPEGVPTMGVRTKTSTGSGCSPDCVTDDSCL